MTEIQNPKQKNNRFEPVWNWRFYPQNSKAEPSISDPRNAGQAWPKGPGFSGQNKLFCNPGVLVPMYNILE